MLSCKIRHYLDKHKMAYRLVPDCQLCYFKSQRIAVSLVTFSRPALYLSPEPPTGQALAALGFHLLDSRIGSVLFEDCPVGSLPAFGEPYFVRTFCHESLDAMPELILPTAHPNMSLVLPRAEWFYLTRGASFERVNPDKVVSTRKAS